MKLPTRLTLLCLSGLLAALCCTGGSVKAAPAPTPISEFIQAGMTTLGVPGASIAILDPDGTVYSEGFGFADLSGKTVTAQTPFPIASVSKSFTSLILLQLEEDGKLNIDDPVIEYIPYFTMQDHQHASAITVRHLMDHTSGLTTVDGNTLGSGAPNALDANEHAVRALKAAVPFAPPGKTYQYSNANYRVMGLLIEVLTGQPFESVVTDRIFRRLNMSNAYLFDTDAPATGYARGHNLWFGSASENHTQTTREGFAIGGIKASAMDMAAYLQAVMKADPDIVPRRLAEKWREPSFEGYAYGWYHTTEGGKRLIMHDGFAPGFRAQVILMPDEKKAVFLAMNAAGLLDGRLHAIAARRALNLPHDDLDSLKSFLVYYWGGAALVLMFALGGIVTLWRAYNAVKLPWPYPEPLRYLAVILPALGFGFLAFAMVTLIPISLGLNLGGVGVFFPDLHVLLVCVAGIAVIWAIVLPILLIKRPRRPVNSY